MRKERSDCRPAGGLDPREVLAALGLWILLCGFGGATEGKKGMVASANPLASAAGVAALKAGGNAVDAVVATAFTLSVIEPYSAGMGGGGFLIYRDAKTGHVSVVDYREVAPKAAHRDMYLGPNGKADPKKSLDGWTSVAVPTMVPGLAEAQQKLGKKKLGDVLPMAIELAEKGYRVDPHFHEDAEYRLEVLKKDPEAAKIFLSGGEPWPVGSLLIQRDLAKTLKELATVGPSLFTTGRVAQAMAAEAKRRGGALGLEDLKAIKARWRTPLVGSYQGFEVITMPPPSSGGTHLLQILKLLEIDRATRGRVDDGRDWEDLHMLVESMRLAYADRAEYMGDPAFLDVPVEKLLADDYLKARYAQIDRKKTVADLKAGVIPGWVSPAPSSPAPAKEPTETTHISVIDAEGNAASLTQTVNYAFGACVVVPGTGVLMNDEMDDFSAAPGAPNAYGLVGGEANSIQPGKIPLSSMTPTILVKDGKARLAIGAPGGSTIITTVLQVILHVVDHKMSLARAIAAPRIHHQWAPDVLRIEAGALDPAGQKALKAYGHKLKISEDGWGNASGVWVDDAGLRHGAADPRGVGAAVAE
ncbi:MAG: gamma-glutamyltransferase [Myxococcota bacterium]